MKQLIYISLLIGFVFAQSDTNPVRISTSGDSISRSGEVFNIKIDIEMDDEWHIYSIYKSSEGPLPTEISISGTAVGQIAPIQEPEPLYLYDPGFETDTYFHEGDTEFTLPMRMKRNLAPGDYELYIDVFYMVCNARLCYPPMTKTDTLLVEIEKGPPREGFSTFATLGNKDIGSSNSSNNKSILGILLLAIGGAVLSWVMPCVYPMIPIIISFFSKMSQEKHVGKNTIALIYGLGISGTFVIIGLIVGLLSWGIEDVAAQARNANIGNFIATNPWINLFLGILFIFFALWMFGVININVAGSLVNKTDKAGQTAKSAVCVA